MLRASAMLSTCCDVQASLYLSTGIFVLYVWWVPLPQPIVRYAALTHQNFLAKPYCLGQTVGGKGWWWCRHHHNTEAMYHMIFSIVHKQGGTAKGSALELTCCHIQAGLYSEQVRLHAVVNVCLSHSQSLAHHVYLVYCLWCDLQAGTVDGNDGISSTATEAKSHSNFEILHKQDSNAKHSALESAHDSFDAVLHLSTGTYMHVLL